MLRLFMLLWLAAVLPLAAASIDTKIKKSEHKLRATKSDYAKMDRKLAQIAAQIEANRKKIAQLDKIIAAADEEIAKNAGRLAEGQKRLTQIEAEAKLLDANRSRQQEALVKTLANRYILEEIKKEKGIEEPEDVVERKILDALVKEDTQRLKKMERDYLATLSRSESLAKEAANLKAMIQRLQKRKEEAATEKARRKALAAKLQKEKKSYQARLEKLQKEEANLRKTLARLHIIRRKALEEARKNRPGVNRQTLAKGERIRVRQIGSSYQRDAVGHYRGPKTISPVRRAKVVKKFGSYVDPIYHIRIFNDSVTLQPARSNAKVKNVLNGRVVFAKKSQLLGNVVIVEHRNGLHTIYAKMDKIAPTIREGKKIRKGYVIGRVKRELMFEVTQNNRHINPLELIRLR